ncbi:MAG: hypothetical protein AB7N76_13405 [Planctomycetota bacterium]
MTDPVPADLLEILCCPEDRSALRKADADQVAALNAAIAAGKVQNKGGEPVTEAVSGALVRADGAVLYPVREFAVLLVEEGIAASQLG